MFYCCLQEVSSVHLPQERPAEKGKFSFIRYRQEHPAWGRMARTSPQAACSHNVS